jgi:hypothetical protein
VGQYPDGAMPRPPTPIRFAAVVALACVLCSCFTGLRPSFSEDANAPGTVTGDRAIDAVLIRLDRASKARFTGDYEILTRYGNLTSEAEVVQAAPDRRAITIGDVEFVIDGESTKTCRTERVDCVQQVEDSYVSDLQVTHRFYAESAAAKLRQAASDRLGEATGSRRRIAGRPARCVDVEVTGGAKQFCALDTGVLALLDDAAVHVTLTEYSKNVDATQLG